MVCTVRLNLLLRTSFSSSAKMIGAGKPNRMVRLLIKKVLRRSGQKLGPVKNCSNENLSLRRAEYKAALADSFRKWSSHLFLQSSLLIII